MGIATKAAPCRLRRGTVGALETLKLEPTGLPVSGPFNEGGFYQAIEGEVPAKLFYQGKGGPIFADTLDALLFRVEARCIVEGRDNVL